MISVQIISCSLALHCEETGSQCSLCTPAPPGASLRRDGFLVFTIHFCTPAPPAWCFTAKRRVLSVHYSLLHPCTTCMVLRCEEMVSQCSLFTLNPCTTCMVLHCEETVSQCSLFTFEPLHHLHGASLRRDGFSVFTIHF